MDGIAGEISRDNHCCGFNGTSETFVLLFLLVEHHLFRLKTVMVKVYPRQAILQSLDW